MMEGALDMQQVTCSEAMVNLDKCFMLPKDAKLDFETMAQIMASGFSRVPVYDSHKHNVCGLLLVKKLIVLDPEDARPVSEVLTRKPEAVALDASLLDVLETFASGRSHLAVVTNEPERVEEALRKGEPIPASVHMAGILTLEDVLERVIQWSISDETDKNDVQQKLRQATTAYTERGDAAKRRRVQNIKNVAAGMLQRKSVTKATLETPLLG